MVKNNIETIETEYIKPSRTIETILLSKNQKEIKVYLYNFEGNHFRLFLKNDDLINFFENKDVDFKEFINENDLDNFLLNFEI